MLLPLFQDHSVILHAVQTGVQLIARGRVKAARRDLAVEFILDLVEQGRFLAEDLFLDVDEEVEVFVDLVGVLLHKLSERLAGDILGADRPFAVNLADLEELGDIQSCLFDARLIQRFIKDIRLAVIAVEYLEDGIAVFIDDLFGSLCQNLIICITHHIPPYTSLCSP